MARSYWYDKATAAIDRALERVELASASKREIEQAVDDAYPLGMRKNFPYKQWLAARKHVLRVRCPRLFSVTPGRGVDREAAAGLFAPPQLVTDPLDALVTDVPEQRDRAERDGQDVAVEEPREVTHA